MVRELNENSLVATVQSLVDALGHMAEEAEESAYSDEQNTAFEDGKAEAFSTASQLLQSLVDDLTNEMDDDCPDDDSDLDALILMSSYLHADEVRYDE